MRALRFVEAGRPLEMQELPTPEPGPGEVLVRIEAAGICHSDVHYRAGFPRVPTPLTLGHEVAGSVAAAGPDAAEWHEGDRVAVHYQLSCGVCDWCRRGSEQFCPDGAMLGNGTNGGYAEYLAVPGRNLFRLPEEIPFTHGSIMMCSSATAFHALRKGRLEAGETVAVFGTGGLGMSAVQIAAALGAASVFAVDLSPSKLAMAEGFGAVPVDAAAGNPVDAIRERTAGRGVDVALELVGLPLTVAQAVASLAPMGRTVAVGLSHELFELGAYTDLIKREAEVIGSADHLASELPELIEMARTGALDLTDVVSATVPLEADSVNAAMDALEAYGDAVRTVITP